MANTIQTNVASLNARRNLEKTSSGLSTSLQRLSSGMRINSARDDAAGLQISNRLTSQVNGLNQSVRNANDGISLAQTAEGALQESTNILQRIRDLSVQSANGSNSASERKALQQEVGQLIAEMNRISDTTAFGGKKLLDGKFGSSAFQVGSDANQTIGVSLQSASAEFLGQNRFDMVDGTGLNAILANATVAGAEGANVDASTLNLTITGSLGVATVATVTGSAKDVAEAINAVSADTGVTADARTVVELSGFGTGSLSFTLQGKQAAADAVSISASINDTDDLSALADAINQESGKTGITATANGEGAITLVSENGDNISLGEYVTSSTDTNFVANMQTFKGDANSANASASAVTATITEGTATTDSFVAQGIVRLDGGGQGFTYASASATLDDSTSGGSSLTSVEDINISTAAGAQEALGIVDGAIATIDSMRSSLGAVQNRLGATISNLQNISENVSAARSQIRDTDFAETTAELAKQQVLQQAGLSMLAQANASGQSVLSLLQ